jgi:putative hydrolase of the HAD superfamily
LNPLTTNEQRELQRWRSIVTYVFDDVAVGSNALFESLWKHFASTASWQLFDDVVPAWQALTDRGFQLGLASNFDGRLVSLCDGLPPLNEADFCFISSHLKYPKPHPRFYHEIQRLLELEPSQLLLIGDDLVNDYEAPRAAGWHAVHLCRQGAPHRHAITSLEELPGLLA